MEIRTQSFCSTRIPLTDAVNMRKSDSLTTKLLAGVVFLVAIVTIGGMVLPSCSFSSYDSFSNTDPSFQLDKDNYSVGDTITLTLELRGESNVRFYENIENTLKVWLAFRVPYQGEHTVVTYDGIHSEKIEPRDPGDINTYRLEKSKPLLLSFHGYLQETEEMDAFVIVFPSLNRKFIVQKEDYANALSLEIHGHLTPINHHPVDSLEDYVRPKKLSIQS